MKTKNTNTQVKPIGHIVEELAGLFDVTTQYVSMVVRGRRFNKAIKDAYDLMEREHKKVQAKLQNQIKNRAKMSAKPKKQAA